MKATRGLVDAQALGAWDGLVFSDDEGGGRKELRQRVRRREWEPAAALRRFVALERWVLPQLRDHAFVVLLRPDLWLRQSVDVWDLDARRADVTIPHRECPSLTCRAPGARPTSSSMAPEALFVVRPAWLRRVVAAAAVDEGHRRWFGRFSFGPRGAPLMTGQGVRRSTAYASVRVLAWNGTCCANTRSFQWHPVLSVGPQCCYFAKACRAWTREHPRAPPSEARPSCFAGLPTPPRRPNDHLGCRAADLIAAPVAEDAPWNRGAYAAAPAQPPHCALGPHGGAEEPARAPGP